MIPRKSEQNSETIIELTKEKMMLPYCKAFSSFKNFLHRATIRKSSSNRTTMSSEYRIRDFHTIFFRVPIFANIMSAGSGAALSIILDFYPSSSSLRRYANLWKQLRESHDCKITCLERGSLRVTITLPEKFRTVLLFSVSRTPSLRSLRVSSLVST